MSSSRHAQIRTRRRRQLWHSVPHYFREFREVRSLHEVYWWARHKLPYAFATSRFPMFISLEPTNECNFACPHCPRTVINEGRGLGFMDIDLFEKIADEVSACDGACVLKMGGLGEPALHPQLAKMMEMLQERQIRTILYTNGTLLHEYPLQVILGWRFWILIVSIDGTDARSFERLRLGGNYLSIRSAVKRFRRAREESSLERPRIDIRHVIMPSETAAQLESFRADWLAVGDTVKFNYLLPPLPSSRVEDVSRPRCRDIKREMYIRYDGRVPLCGYHDEWLGNVRHSSIAALWHHPRLEDVRARHERRALAELPFCRTCAFR